MLLRALCVIWPLLSVVMFWGANNPFLGTWFAILTALSWAGLLVNIRDARIRRGGL